MQGRRAEDQVRRQRALVDFARLAQHGVMTASAVEDRQALTS
jgi:hypothetical protein